jgi:hypothetical protein
MTRAAHRETKSQWRAVGPLFAPARFTVGLCLAVGALALAPVAAAAAPPVLVSNGAVKPIVACATEPGCTEPRGTRSLSEPLVGWGIITLHGEELGTAGVRCRSVLAGDVWNEHEGANKARPVRAYGLLEGWTTASCSRAQLTCVGEGGSLPCEPTTPFITDEGPLELEYTEVEVPITEGGCKGSPEKPACYTTTELVRAARRRPASVPWKSEFVRGLANSGEEEVVQQRIGMAKFGECGPGEAEETEGSPVVCRATNASSSCYPASEQLTEVPAGCIAINLVIPQVPLEVPFFGGLEAIWRNGAGSGIDPGHGELREEKSGRLVSQRDVLGEADFAGTVKELGAEGQALLSLR